MVAHQIGSRSNLIQPMVEFEEGVAGEEAVGEFTTQFLSSFFPSLRLLIPSLRLASEYIGSWPRLRSTQPRLTCTHTSYAIAYWAWAVLEVVVFVMTTLGLAVTQHELESEWNGGVKYIYTTAAGGLRDMEAKSCGCVSAAHFLC